jgi:hypothetical protein
MFNWSTIVQGKPPSIAFKFVYYIPPNITRFSQLRKDIGLKTYFCLSVNTTVSQFKSHDILEIILSTDYFFNGLYFLFEWLKQFCDYLQNYYIRKASL